VPTQLSRIRKYLDALFADREPEALEQLMLPSEDEVSPRLVGGTKVSSELVKRRWSLLRRTARTSRQEERTDEIADELLDARTRGRLDTYSGNIENFVGTVELPIGIAGPLRVRGLFAHGDFYVPLATTEAALVSSYSRGAQAISAAGGCTALVVSEGVSRAPAFAFVNLIDAGKFVVWLSEHLDELAEAAESTTRYGKLVDAGVHLEGNHVYLLLEFTTGEAAGQNMVTIAAEAVCQYILGQCPIQPDHWFVEANLSGDKKASHLSFQHVRGKKVTAEVVLPKEILQRRLRCTAKEMQQYYRMSSIGGVMSGNIGVQGHYANGLAAAYIACGQDAACVAESAVGITRFEPAPDGALYAAVTLPNVIVGTVGGGTGLPSQRACLDLLQLEGPSRANAFAEIVTSLVLAGELSIIAALASGDFVSAHESLARKRHRGD